VPAPVSRPMTTTPVTTPVLTIPVLSFLYASEDSRHFSLPLHFRQATGSAVATAAGACGQDDEVEGQEDKGSGGKARGTWIGGSMLWGRGSGRGVVQSHVALARDLESLGRHVTLAPEERGGGNTARSDTTVLM